MNTDSVTSSEIISASDPSGKSVASARHRNVSTSHGAPGKRVAVRKIKVLQLIEGLNLGGAETKLMELVAHMDRDRFETVVCSLGMGDRIRQEFEKLKVEFITWPRQSRVDVSLIFKVAKLIREKQIDVVMTTLFYADVLGALAGVFSKPKAVFSWETISAPEWLLTHRLLAYRFAMRFCTRVISVSHATAKWLIEKRGVPPEKVVVIPYGVNLDLYRAGENPELKQKLGIEHDAKVIGVVARLHPQKGHRYLIEAAKSIVAKYPKTKFVVVGDGELRAELESMAKAQGVAENFLFLGFRKDVKDLMRVFDVFCLPSLYEGLPNVVLEAMATAKPVVATAVDGTPELIVDEETGYLVPPADPRALAEKISLLVANEELARRFGNNGLRRVQAEYSLEKQVEGFQNLYQRFVAQHE
jgi:glycosyltransferase involved in cell wall biosynthesis